MVILTVCLLVTAILQYVEMRNLRKIVMDQKTPPKEPPKGRASFVVKRWEERIKEALYE